MNKLLIALGILVFITFPYFIDQVIINKLITNWDIGQWSGFLGSYLGGGVGGAITLCGVYYEITNREKKEKNESKKKFNRISTFFFDYFL